MTDWIQEYFVNPLARPDDYAPYNLVNTVLFAVLALIAAYLIYRGLKRFGVRIDEWFFYAILPFVVFGGALRVVVDAGILPRAVTLFSATLYPFVTPGIYVFTFAVVILVLISARIASKRFGADFAKTVFATSVFLACVSLTPLAFLFKNWLFFAAILALALLALIVFSEFSKKRGLRASALEKITVFAQSLDGAATFVGVQFAGYWEQQLLSGFVFNFGGPIAFFLLKVAFAFVVVEVLRDEKVEKQQRAYLLLLVTIFGLAPGVRDALRILCGV